MHPNSPFLPSTFLLLRILLRFDEPLRRYGDFPPSPRAIRIAGAAAAVTTTAAAGTRQRGDATDLGRCSRPQPAATANDEQLVFRLDRRASVVVFVLKSHTTRRTRGTSASLQVIMGTIVGSRSNSYCGIILMTLTPRRHIDRHLPLNYL